jgi:hypothetical protein
MKLTRRELRRLIQEATSLLDDDAMDTWPYAGTTKDIYKGAPKFTRSREHGTQISYPNEPVTTDEEGSEWYDPHKGYETYADMLHGENELADRVEADYERAELDTDEYEKQMTLRRAAARYPEEGENLPKHQGMGRRSLSAPTRDVRSDRRISEGQIGAPYNADKITKKQLRKLIHETLEIYSESCGDDDDAYDDLGIYNVSDELGPGGLLSGEEEDYYDHDGPNTPESFPIRVGWDGGSFDARNDEELEMITRDLVSRGTHYSVDSVSDLEHEPSVEADPVRRSRLGDTVVRKGGAGKHWPKSRGKWRER